MHASVNNPLSWIVPLQAHPHYHPYGAAPHAPPPHHNGHAGYAHPDAAYPQSAAPPGYHPPPYPFHPYGPPPSEHAPNHPSEPGFHDLPTAPAMHMPGPYAGPPGLGPAPWESQQAAAAAAAAAQHAAAQNTAKAQDPAAQQQQAGQSAGAVKLKPRSHVVAAMPQGQAKAVLHAEQRPSHADLQRPAKLAKPGEAP